MNFSRLRGVKTDRMQRQRQTGKAEMTAPPPFEQSMQPEGEEGGGWVAGCGTKGKKQNSNLGREMDLRADHATTTWLNAPLRYTHTQTHTHNLLQT